MTKPKSPYIIPVQTSFMLTFRCTDCNADNLVQTTINKDSPDFSELEMYAPFCCANCGNDTFHLTLAQQIR